VLLSYSKIALLHDLLASSVPDEKALEPLLLGYFPPALATRYADDIRGHRLRREIIATTLTNQIVNRLGSASPQRMADETARPVAEIAHAFTIARAVLGLPDIWQQIDALDGKIGGQIQLELYSRTQDALAHTTRWFMRDGQAVGASGGLDAAIATHAKGAADLAALLDGKIAGGTKGKLDAARQQLADEGVPSSLAADLARLAFLVDAPAITEAAARSGAPQETVARVMLGLNERFHLRELIDAGRRIRATDSYDLLAIAGAEQALLDARRRIALGILAEPGASALDAWKDRHESEIGRVAQTLDALTSSGQLTPSRLMVAATRLGDLSRTGA
jgi:glutamate dehydrogenase